MFVIAFASLGAVAWLLLFVEGKLAKPAAVEALQHG
jgi:hypothetical protein